MKSVAVFVFLLVLAAAGPLKPKYVPMHWLHMDPEGRIAGGEETTIEENPWHIALLENDIQICSGAILNPTHILTAAHCCLDLTTVYSIRAGSTSRSSGGQVVRVSDKRANELYNSGTMDFDIAVLKLASALIFGPGVASITPASVRAPDGDEATVTGWGGTEWGGSSVDILRIATTPIYSKTDCGEFIGSRYITDRMVCAGEFDGGVDVCQGDYGGPLVGTNGELVGIASWGRTCALPLLPGVYASIPELKDWIDANSDF